MNLEDALERFAIMTEAADVSEEEALSYISQHIDFATYSKLLEEIHK